MTPEFIRRIGERIGILETPQKKTAKLERIRESLETIEEFSREKLKRLHMLTKHSDASLDEVEYILGISSRDPHPTHPIEFKECNCESQD